jgi:pseudouridine-5'-phosphate glycosidase
MPAFYSRQSGLPVDVEVGSVKEAAEVIIARDDLQLPGAVLVTVPVPANDEMPALVMRDILENALTKAKEQNITGKNVTPFLLAEMASQSTGRTLATNIALLKNNARVAAEIAVELS